MPDYLEPIAYSDRDVHYAEVPSVCGLGAKARLESLCKKRRFSLASPCERRCLPGTSLPDVALPQVAWR